MEHLSNDHKYHSNELKNSHKLRDEMGHPILGMIESQWKLRQPHDQMENHCRENHCRTNISARRKKEIQKSWTVKVMVRDASKKVNHLSEVI